MNTTYSLIWDKAGAGPRPGRPEWQPRARGHEVPRRCKRRQERCRSWRLGQICARWFGPAPTRRNGRIAPSPVRPSTLLPVLAPQAKCICTSQGRNHPPGSQGISRHTEPLKKAVATYRSEIAALKRRVETLERQAKRSAKVVTSVQPERPDLDTQHRFRAKGLATHRQRLGLSAAACGALLGVSPLSVYKWEDGQIRPRASYLPAIAAVRLMGKREAATRLEQLSK